MPMGIWWETSAASVPKAGDVVVVCPQLTDRQKVYLDPGHCPSHREPVLKPVAAVAGDVVSVSSAGITVNGMPVTNSAPLAVDGAGRPLQAYPAGTYTVAAGQMWLVAPLPYSFDSRYLGPLPVSAIEGTAKPVLVW